MKNKTDLRKRNIQFAKDVTETMRSLEKEYGFKKHKKLSFSCASPACDYFYGFKLENISKKSLFSKGTDYRFTYIIPQIEILYSGYEKRYKTICEFYAILSILLRESKGECLFRDLILTVQFSPCDWKNSIDSSFLQYMDFSDEEDIQASFLVLLWLLESNSPISIGLSIGIEELTERAKMIVRNTDDDFWNQGATDIRYQVRAALITGGLLYDGRVIENDCESLKEMQSLVFFLASADDEDIYVSGKQCPGFKILKLNVSRNIYRFFYNVDPALIVQLADGKTKRTILDKVIVNAAAFTDLNSCARATLSEILKSDQDLFENDPDSHEKIKKNVERLISLIKQLPETVLKTVIQLKLGKLLEEKSSNNDFSVFFENISNEILEMTADHFEGRSSNGQMILRFVMTFLLGMNGSIDQNAAVVSYSFSQDVILQKYIDIFPLIRSVGKRKTMAFLTEYFVFLEKHPEQENLHDEEIKKIAGLMKEDDDFVFEWILSLIRTEEIVLAADADSL